MTEPSRTAEPSLSRDRAPGDAAAERQFRQMFCGDIDIRIARDGTWFHEGSPIGRKPLVKLFAGVMERDEAGDYWLVTPVERARIRVEDAPFLAVELTVEGRGRDQRLTFRTNVDDHVTADARHPIRVAMCGPRDEPAPYVLVRGRLEAKIARAVYYQLVDLGVEEVVEGRRLLGVWSAGAFFPVGPLPDDA